MTVRSITMQRITVAEASQRTGVPPATILHAIDQGRIAGYRDGHRILVDPDELGALTS